MEIAKRGLFKKNLAWLLAVAMVIGVIPAMAKPMEVHAAGYVIDAAYFAGIGDFRLGETDTNGSFTFDYVKQLSGAPANATLVSWYAAENNLSEVSYSNGKWTITKYEPGDAIYIRIGEGNNDIIEVTFQGILHTHTWDNTWTTDATYHWHACTAEGCDGSESSKKDKAEHIWVTKYNNEKHWQECSVCGKKKDETTHTLSWVTTDANQHWQKCSGCNYTTTKANHNWKDTHNETQHWQYCDVCQKTRNKENHIYGTSGTDTSYYTCTNAGCGYVNNTRKADYDAAANVRAMITALPDPTEVTLDDDADIKAARTAYNALNDTAESLISDTDVKKLKDNEDYYAALFVETKINAIPELSEITSEDKDVIDEARAAYDKLSDDQEALVSEEAKTKLTDSEDYYAAAVVREKIEALPDEITADNLADAKTAISAARSAYDALNETRQGIVGEEAYDKLADLEMDVVKFMINALPEAGKIKTTDKAAIEAARAEYEALPTQAQKDEFPEDVLQKLIDAESELEARFVEEAIDNLPDAFDVASTDAAEINAVSADYNALSDEQKEMIDEELRDKLAEVEKKLNARLVEDVLKALHIKRNVKNTDKAAIEAAREAYDALSDEEKAMVNPDLVSRLIADEEEVIKKMLDALPADTTTPEYAEQVEAIKKAYDELSDEQKEDLGEDVADEINDANDKVQEAKFINAVDAIPSPITVDNKDVAKTAIDKAKAEYDKLSDKQKEDLDEIEIDNPVEKLNNAEKDYVKAMIAAVEPITGDDADITRINAAKAAYNALTEAQKAELEADRQQAMGDDYKDVLSELEDAEKKHEEEQVKDLIDAILTPIDSTDAATKKAIDDAREAYDALSPEQKANVDNSEDGSGENYNEVLKDAEKDFVKDMVSNIAKPDSATQTQDELDDIKDAIDAAKEAYDALTDEEKEELAADPATDPAKALDELNDEYAEETVKEMVAAIDNPDADTQDTEAIDKIKDAIDAAQDAYDNLTDKQKEDLAKDPTTDPAEKLEALEDKYEEEAVKDMIKNIPDMSGDMTDEEIKDAKEAIDAAREAYDALSDEQKANVDAAKDPTTGENYDDMLEEAEVDVVEKMIEALPDDISTADKDAIDEAREAYEKLSPDQKAAVDKDDLDKLEEAEEKYAEEKDKEDTAAANAVTSAINKLPSADNVKLSDKDAIEAARKAYNSLTADQKKKVSAATLKKLTDAEAALKKLQDEANKKDDSDKKKDEYKEEWHNGQWYDKDGKATYKPKGEWKKNSTGWWYEDTAGWYPKSQWQKIDGKWYYFDASGYMAANEWVDGYWLSSDGSWTYEPRGSWKLNSTGWWYEDTAGWYPKNQWQKIDGKWYYFNSDGYMASNQNIGQWRVGSDGAWVE